MSRKRMPAENEDFLLFGNDDGSFNDPYIEMKSVDGFVINPITYMRIDAENEWNTDPNMAEKSFLFTETFSKFADYSSLILIGRTGTGKTSIIRCMHAEIEKRRKEGRSAGTDRLKGVDNYDISFVIHFKEILQFLAREEIDFSGPTIIYELPDIIKMWVHIMMMIEILKSEDNTSGLIKIRSYLESKELYKDDHPVANGIRLLFKTAKNTAQESGKLGLIVIADIINSLLDSGYNDALTEMYNFLKGKNALVLVDTLDEYNLRSNSILKCTKALIAACFDFYNNATRDRIWLKASLPSEIYTMLVDSLPGKQRYNTVIIQWSNKDLIKMIAMKLLEVRDQGHIAFKGEYDYKDFYEINRNSYNNALKLIYEILPEKCPTSLWIGSDQNDPLSQLLCPTIHYCIRHTLKKPREILTIFNHFLSAIIDQRKGTEYFIDNPGIIKDYIHSTQEDLIGSALSMYETTYPHINGICYTVLQGMNAICFGKDFDNRLKTAEAQIEADYRITEKYDKKDIQRILLESGLVGQMVDSSIVRIKDQNNGEGKSIRNSYRAVSASYEYQVKGHLEMKKDTKCVIHPMCYEHFGCRVRQQTVVFPDRFDQMDTTIVGLKYDTPEVK